jgi:hypothetical protein
MKPSRTIIADECFHWYGCFLPVAIALLFIPGCFKGMNNLNELSALAQYHTDEELRSYSDLTFTSGLWQWLKLFVYVLPVIIIGWALTAVSVSRQIKRAKQVIEGAGLRTISDYQFFFEWACPHCGSPERIYSSETEQRLDSGASHVVTLASATHCGGCMRLLDGDPGIPIGGTHQRSRSRFLTDEEAAKWRGLASAARENA